MANPKRRQSKSRQKKRRAASRWTAPQLGVCSNCGAAKPSHVACPSCGYYKERQVLNVEVEG